MNDAMIDLHAIISMPPHVFTKGELARIIDAANAHKPTGYDEWASGVRLRFEGKQENIVRAALAKRYPATHARMAVVALNWVKLFAANDAGVYARNPQRDLIAPDGDKSTDEKKNARLAEIEKASSIDAVLADLEIKTLAAGTMFASVDWDTLDDAPRVQAHWPADTICICHHSAPADIRRAYVFGHLVPSPNGSKDEAKWWRIFTRSFSSVDGDVVFGDWNVQVVSSEGYSRDGSVYTYKGKLPVFVFHAEIPHGSIYLDVDRDLVNVCDALNVSKSNGQHILDMQGHTPIYYAGDAVEVNTLQFGPDVITKIGGNELLQTLSLSPAFEDIREDRKLAMRELAVTRSNSPDAYATEPGPPLSGISRIVQNIQHDLKISRTAQGFARSESTQLWPIVFEQEAFFSNNPSGLLGMSVNVVFDLTAAYESSLDIAQRVGDALDRRLISQAAAAVQILPEVYPTIADAVGVGLSDQIGAPIALSAPSSGIAEALSRPATSRPADTQEEEAVDDGR